MNGRNGWINVPAVEERSVVVIIVGYENNRPSNNGPVGFRYEHNRPSNNGGVA